MSWKKNKWNNYWNNQWQRQIEWEQKKAQYQEYLQSENWDSKRQYLFNLLGRACELCGNSDVVQVHHLTYERLYQERKSDLLVVCSKCHGTVDKNRREYNGQDYFAYWVFNKYGDDWRGKTSFLDMALIFAFEAYGINPEKITSIFGVEL